MKNFKYLKHVSIISLILFAFAIVATAGPSFSGRTSPSSFSSGRSSFSSGSSWSKPSGYSSSSSWSKPSTSSWSKPSTTSTSSWFSSKPASTSSWSKPAATTTPSARKDFFSTVAKAPAIVKEVPAVTSKTYTTSRSTSIPAPTNTRVVEKHYYSGSSNDGFVSGMVTGALLNSGSGKSNTTIINNGTPAAATAEVAPNAPQNLRVEKEESSVLNWLLGIAAFCVIAYAIYRIAQRIRAEE